MKPQTIYPSLLTADLQAAERWYIRFFGRRPDLRPMPSLVQWELLGNAGFMLSDSEEIAAPGALFIYVEDLAAERQRLQGEGIELGADIAGDYSMLAQVRDPDDNLITLASPPTKPFPAA
jgi:predicted enzyme related to lactoylglutathione lyase